MLSNLIHVGKAEELFTSMDRKNAAEKNLTGRAGYRLAEVRVHWQTWGTLQDLGKACLNNELAY